MKRTFEEWKEAVDEEVFARTGLSADDLPDVCYRDWYDDDVSPASAARRALRSAMD